MITAWIAHAASAGHICDTGECAGRRGQVGTESQALLYPILGFQLSICCGLWYYRSPGTTVVPVFPAPHSQHVNTGHGQSWSIARTTCVVLELELVPNSLFPTWEEMSSSGHWLQKVSPFPPDTSAWMCRGPPELTVKDRADVISGGPNHVLYQMGKTFF